MKPAALVFDLDDTLYPEREFVSSGFAAVDRWLRERRQITGFATEAGRLFEEGVRGHIFDDALDRLGVTGAGGLIPEMVDVYRRHSPGLRLFPDAEWAIRHFHRKVKLGLITDGYAEVQRRKLASLRIELFFDSLLFTDDLGRENWKPSPNSFQKMMEALGCPAAGCVYVGDNPAKDFVAPNRLGWTTIQVAREQGEYSGVAADALPADHRAKHVVRTLTCLGEILRE